MWRTPAIHGPCCTVTSETLGQDEESDPAAASGDPVDTDDILPSSAESLLLLNIPVDTSLVSELLQEDSVSEMGSDIQSQQIRDQSSRTHSNSQRICPCILPDCNAPIVTSSGHCNGQNLAGDGIGQINNEEASSLQLLTQQSNDNQDFENMFENESTSGIESTDLDLSLNDTHMAVDNFLNQADSDQDNDSIGTFSDTLSQLRPSYSPSNYSLSPYGRSYQSSSTESDFFFEPETELSVIPLIESDATQRELYEMNTKCIFDIPPQISHITKPLLRLDEPFLSPHRRVFDLPMPTTNAKKLANNLIKRSRYLKCPELFELCCPDCRYIPVQPVTSKCGHTRCMSCILVKTICPCGDSAPKDLFVNTVIREITEKMLQYINISRINGTGSYARRNQFKTCPLTGATKKYTISRRQYQQSSLLFPTGSSKQGVSRPRVPMTVQARHYRARHLIHSGKYMEASSHLVRVAASAEPSARPARFLLAQTISALYGGESSISRKLSRSVREQATHSWLRSGDLECVLCTNTYSNPVTTPCGHNYCRACIERSMYYKKQCALCLGSLENFSLPETRDTIFISSILSSIDVSPLPTDTIVIPIVTCYVAFPGMPCPLFIFDPRYWLMIRRVLDSGSRKFGMLAYERGHTFADFGTVLEICDCVALEDSRCIVSTVGVSRFRVIERFKIDGFDVARVQSLTDITPTRDEAKELHILAVRIYCKAIEWLKNMYNHVLEEIETAFGALPYDDRPEELGTTLDGPNWLWWLIAILPLKSNIKILILSTRSLLKRMLAVSRTLDVMDSNFTIFNRNNN